MTPATSSFGRFDEAGDFVFFLRPYYQDTDAGGVVYHARYLEFAERARNELLRHFALPTTLLAQEEGVLFAVRSLQGEWHKPAFLEGLLAIKTRPLALSGARLTFRQAFFALESSAESSVSKSSTESSTSSDAPAPLVVLCLTLACMEKDTGQATRIPARLAKALSGHWHGLPQKLPETNPHNL